MITKIDWLGFVRCALTENTFVFLRAFVLNGVFQHQLKFRIGATDGMRRKSMNSKSDVTVRTVVIFISRPLCFLVLDAEVEHWSMEHSTESSTWTGSAVPDEVTLVSVTLRIYSGKSLAADKTSKPKGDRRFSSYEVALSRGTYNS